MKKYFRFHAGSLDASMKTQVEVENLEDIVKVINNTSCFPHGYLKFIHIDDVPIKDERIASYGWGDTEYKVLADFDGHERQCIGFTNFRIPSLAEQIGKAALELFEAERKEKESIKISQRLAFMNAQGGVLLDENGEIVYEDNMRLKCIAESSVFIPTKDGEKEKIVFFEEGKKYDVHKDIIASNCLDEDIYYAYDENEKEIPCLLNEYAMELLFGLPRRH